MFFDHKTGKTTGKLDRVTPEEMKFLDEMVEKGVMVRTQHFDVGESVAWLKLMNDGELPDLIDAAREMRKNGKLPKS